MAVMVPREEVTEHRLDALEKKVDDGFAEVKSEMRGRFDRMDERFDRMDDRFDRMQHMLIGSAAVIAAALIGGSAF